MATGEPRSTGASGRAFTWVGVTDALVSGVGVDAGVAVDASLTELLAEALAGAVSGAVLLSTGAAEVSVGRAVVVLLVAVVAGRV